MFLNLYSTDVHSLRQSDLLGEAEQRRLVSLALAAAPHGSGHIRLWLNRSTALGALAIVIVGLL